MTLENLADKFCYWAEQSLEKLAAAKKKTKKTKKKLDPKAKVRNRGTVCVPAASAKDKKDHFPINSEDQARNALARVHQYSSVPPWYKGSLKGLQALVSRKVHGKYPSIGKSDKKSKKTKKSELAIELLKLGSKFEQKLAQQQPQQDITEQLNKVLVPYGYAIQPGASARVLHQEKYVDVPVAATAKAKWRGKTNQNLEVKKILDPITTSLVGFTSKPVIYT